MKVFLSVISNAYQKARISLFYVPILISAVFVCAAIGLIQIDINYSNLLLEYPNVFGRDNELSRSIIKLMLSLMVTMTTLVVSITMVVLSLSASQLGPRLIKSFMSAKQTQVYMGVFFGTIAYCFVLVAVLHSSGLDSPLQITSLFGVVICFFNLFVLLSYVNYVAHAGNADNVIDRVNNEFKKAWSHLKQKNKSNANLDHKMSANDYQKINIFSPLSGYLQSIEYSALLDLCEENDFLIKINKKAGDFVIQESNFIDLYHTEKISDSKIKSVLDCVIIGDEKTATQDVEYSVRHMVEIGLMALSPGINDNFTAIKVIDKISGSLGEIFKDEFKEYCLYDKKGVFRVYGVSHTFPYLIDKAFSSIRDAAKQKPDVLSQMIIRIYELKNIAKNDDQKQALDKHLNSIRDYKETYFQNTVDGEKIENLLAQKNS